MSLAPRSLHPLLLGALLGGSALDAAPRPFADVPGSHWAAPEVQWLRDQGLIEGWGDDFHGERSFTRYEMAEILYRFMQRYRGDRAEVEGELDEVRRVNERQEARLAALFSSGGAGGAGGAASRLTPPPSDGSVDALVARLRREGEGRETRIADLERQLGTLRRLFRDLERRLGEARLSDAAAAPEARPETWEDELARVRASEPAPPPPIPPPPADLEGPPEEGEVGPTGLYLSRAAEGAPRAGLRPAREERSMGAPSPGATERRTEPEHEGSTASPGLRYGPAGTPPQTPAIEELRGDASMLERGERVLVVPPTATAEVVEVVDGKRRFRQLEGGMHRVERGALVRVPADSSAAVWFPSSNRRVLLMEETEVVVRTDDVLRVSGRLVRK